MGDSTIVAEWLSKALIDLNAAKILFEHNCGNEVVAFHCQQVIEKALKAIILHLYATLESGHSLLYLCKKVIARNPEFNKHLTGCIFVNQYYTETRYPNENQIIVTDEEANECIKIAEDILNIVNSKINMEG